MRRRPAKSQRHGRVKRCGKPSRDRHSSTADLQEQLALRTQELSQALEQQTATADVLKIISRSAFDLQAVLDTLLQSASRVCNGDGAGLAVREDEVYRYVANFAQPDEFCILLRNRTFAPGRGSIVGRTALEGKVVHTDLATDPEYTFPPAVNGGQGPHLVSACHCCATA